MTAARPGRVTLLLRPGSYFVTGVRAGLLCRQTDDPTKPAFVASANRNREAYLLAVTGAAALAALPAIDELLDRVATGDPTAIAQARTVLAGITAAHAVTGSNA